MKIDIEIEMNSRIKSANEKMRKNKIFRIAWVGEVEEADR